MASWRDACPALEKCPLNYNYITSETMPWRVVLAFLTGAHQDNSNGPIFTAEQLDLIEHEMTTWPDKLRQCRRDLEEHKRQNGVVVAPSISSLNSTSMVNDLREYSLTDDFHKLDVSTSRDYINTSHGSNGPGIGFFATAKTRKERQPEVQEEPVPPSPKPVPAVTPVGARIHFSSFLRDGNEYLSLEKTDSFMGPDVEVDVQQPLGACYDHIREEFVVADERNDRVVLLPSQTFIFDDLLIKQPSSVCVVEPGVSLAILCTNSIILYMYDCGSVSVICTSQGKNNFRGLTLTPAGNLLTLHVRHSSADINIFGTGEQQTKPLYTIPLLNANRPSFLDMYHTTLVITDLGQQSVFLCNLDDTMADKHNEPIFRIVKQAQPKRWNGQGEPFGSFNFVSGVYIDAEFQILIADAGGHTFQLFDQNLEFLHRVGMDFSVYMSSFAINTKGIVMTCDRRSSALVFSQLTSTKNVPALLPVKVHNGGRGRGGGPRGGRGGFNNGNGRGRGGRGGVFNGFHNF